MLVGYAGASTREQSQALQLDSMPPVRTAAVRT
jgi:hypothetical protein